MDSIEFPIMLLDLFANKEMIHISLKNKPLKRRKKIIKEGFQLEQ